jgi:DNA-binding CsgD family transcriptional regulator/tetratricopeptide (TPR) repeat protein
MTRPDLISRRSAGLALALMVRSDYGPGEVAQQHLPGSLSLESAFPFVGRSAELETLRALMPMAEAEGRRVVLIGGAPGSGKSRLVREFAREAAQDGVLVLYGACDAVVRTPYGPFVEALDRLMRVTDPAELAQAIGAAGGELTRLVPNLPAVVPEVPPPLEADPDTERHRLHTAVTDVLTGIGRRRPVLLVLEDGHWADTPSLLLLRHLALRTADARMLVLGTFRDTEADVPDTLAEILADLRRSDDVRRLRLGGLTEEDVAEFLRGAAGGDAGPGVTELAQAIGALTDGNAFLICELWRTLVETGVAEVSDGRIQLGRPLTELGTPESVREVVTQRLSRVAPRTVDVLELAAAAGSEFELDILRRAVGLPEQELLAAVEEAVHHGIVHELPSRALTYGFTHELVRRALYDRLSGIRRAELHLAVAEALEGDAEASVRALPDLAYHFAAAAPFGGAERGVEYNLRAGRAAIAALDFDEAMTRLRTALELGIEDPRGQADVLLELGVAAHRSGKAPDAHRAFMSAAAIARDLGDAELLARAAVGFEEAAWRPGLTETRVAQLLEEAAAALGEEKSSLRVALLGGLSRALDFRGSFEQAAIVRASAIGMARELGARRELATVLMRSYWSRRTTPLDDILAMLRESAQIGDELGDVEIGAESIAWMVPTHVSLCDLDSARREIGWLQAMADQTAQPFFIHVASHYESAIALCDGLLEQAEAAAHRAWEWSRLLTGRDASGIYGVQMFSIRREQGRLAELAPAVRMLAADSSGNGAWRPGFASLLVELGMEEEARRELTAVAREGLDSFRESLWIASLTYLTDACTALGDQAMAALLYPELELFAGGNVMIGHLVECYGSADRYLGMLCTVLGEFERGERHFEQAMELNRRMGAHTWLAHTAYEYARLLLARDGDSGDRAAALLAEAAALAERIGMQSLLGRIGALGSAPAEPVLPAGLSSREAQIIALIARGMSNREIGETLFISEHTAANHIRSILRKTGCANRTEAASYAHSHGLIEA